MDLGPAFEIHLREIISGTKEKNKKQKQRGSFPATDRPLRETRPSNEHSADASFLDEIGAIRVLYPPLWSFRMMADRGPARVFPTNNIASAYIIVLSLSGVKHRGSLSTPGGFAELLDLTRPASGPFPAPADVVLCRDLSGAPELHHIQLWALANVEKAETISADDDLPGISTNLDSRTGDWRWAANNANWRHSTCPAGPWGTILKNPRRHARL